MHAMILRGGEERLLACKPRTAQIGELAFARYFEDEMDVLPRDAWRPLSDADIRTLVDGSPIPTLDQDGLGACGGFSATTAVHHARDAQGMPFVKLASGRLYHVSGGGHDGGSSLSDNLQACCQLGIPPFVGRDQELDYRSMWTRAETAAALSYRILTALDCPEFKHLATAVQKGMPVQHGIDVGRDYDLDESGLWLRDLRGSHGGHAQCSPARGICYDGKRWGLLVQGTWGTTFGYKGWYVVPESYFATSEFNDGWALCSAVVNADVTAPPVFTPCAARNGTFPKAKTGRSSPREL